MKKITMTMALGLATSLAFAAPEFKVSGEVEVYGEAYYKQVDPRAGVDDSTGELLLNNQSNKTQLLHDFSSTFDLLFEVKFNEKWSGEAAISMDDDNTNPVAAYDGAFIQYSFSDKANLKIGDMTYAEGAFRFYDYDDTGDYAAGMMDHDLRGLEVNYGGLVLAAGFGVEDETAYDVHAVYALKFSGQEIRPYVNYRSYQTTEANELRAGVVANLALGETFSAQIVYALYADALSADEPSPSHAIAVEPEFNGKTFFAKGTFYYTILDEDVATPVDAPEYMFGYLEPGIHVSPSLAVGLPVEYHTMSLDSDASLEQVLAGLKIYVTATENLSGEVFVRVGIPFGDDYEALDAEDPYVGFGAKVAFSF